ncbi:MULTISPECIES: DUF6675 family protein [Treponema]|jgi:hypothetical protein|uniref:Uncharacterized protein n=1 Tax=Treponema saccharophilum DSM 2985 TaxID=907348 RepID=H7EPH3_9SPIR|nr:MULTISPECIES: DUF6675 family protein [Treponema]EIC00374.1 hypothetical protein TresaDRAFT_0468 [Treponema saccharophilum DSM 2985]MBQ5537570.1 hypothetical protein [Treponema sp.]BDC94910.1 hypothetical protein TRSA_00090 [Treponema saccharophilum]
MKRIFAFLGLFVIAVSAFAGVIPESVLDELVASPNRKLQNTFLNDEKVVLSLTPDTELSRKAVGTWAGSGSPRFTTENLFFLKKATLIANSDNGEKCDTSIDAVSKVVRSISKMKGMQYYSNGDKKWETLYHKSHLIDSLKSKKAIPDDLEGSADGKRFYCLQQDNSFGQCVYKLEYFQRDKSEPNEVAVCFTNAENLKYGPVTAVKPGNLNINLVVIDQGSYYLVYMFVQAKYPSLPFLESRLNRSFNARVDAIFKWFSMAF